MEPNGVELFDPWLLPPTLARHGSLRRLSQSARAIVPMNWPRLLEVIAWANARSGNREYTARKPDRGWNWTCYCRVCAELRRLSA